MQSKKKGSSKKLPIRKKINKSFLEPDQTYNTTKEKTFATIQETFQFHDHKTSTRTTHYTSKRDYLDRMEANKLSPFSSPGQSLSPRQRKSVSPIVVKQKQRKKNKKTLVLDLNAKTKKNIPTQSKTNKTPKGKQKAVPKAKAQFQNQFLKRMNRIEQFNGKKITELSQQQMEASIKKRSKQTSQLSLHQNLKLDLIRDNNPNGKKNNDIKKMHNKIKEKYRKTFPKLKTPEIKVLSAIVLMQRLWRQKKVKQMIGQFLSPRAFTISQNATFGNPLFIRSIKQGEQNEIQYTMKTQKSFLSVSPKCSNKNSNLQRNSQQDEHKMTSKKGENNSSQSSNALDCSLISLQPSRSSSINLKDLQLSDELSQNGSATKTKQMIKYVDIYREVFLHQKKEKKKNKKSRPNAFNFPSSLSQKCLLEKLYKKSFVSIKKGGSQSISQVFFPQKNLEKSKEYISPKKPEIVELQERFYTQAQDQELLIPNTKFQKQPIKPEDQTIGTISQVAQQVIEFLICEFSEQYQAFTSKKCLKKKKKLPGITINEKTIKTYLDSFAEYVSENYKRHMKKSIKKITPFSFLKVFRICPEQGIFDSQEEEQEDEDEEDYKIIPKITYFQYQQIYEDKFFTINEEQKKYSNFVSGLIKVHNKCLSDAFSEILQKQRIDGIALPWDSLKPQKQADDSNYQKFQDLCGKFDNTKDSIIKMSKTNLGKLRGRDIDAEESNLLLSLKDDYKREGKDWSCHQQRLEIRLELAQMITQALYAELLQEFPGLNMSK